MSEIRHGNGAEDVESRGRVKQKNVKAEISYMFLELNWMAESLEDDLDNATPLDVYEIEKACSGKLILQKRCF
ncbi:MAG TPA: hypothetical protein PLA80_12305 [Synergistaceae bacterium]|nr:hypothetical protein [Synergistaceae bacterium]